MRKGRLVGCKVNLRRKALFSFFDGFLLAVPRREKLYPFSIRPIKKSIRGLTRPIAIPPFSFRFGELVLFYPIEVGIGLHADLQNRQRTCSFNTVNIEERLFYIRVFHFPVLLFFMMCL